MKQIANTVDVVVLKMVNKMEKENKKGLNTGDQFLGCRMKVSVAMDLIYRAMMEKKEHIDFPAYKQIRTNDSQPHYSSPQVAIWIKKKKAVPEEDIAIEEESTTTVENI